jgi:hypothetical protein
LYLLALTVGGLLAGCAPAPVEPAADGVAVAAIVYPLDGAEFNVGDLVDVESLVEYSTGISNATLLVNQEPYRQDFLSDLLTAGSIYQPWIPTQPGTYELAVVISDGSMDASSNSVTVLVGPELSEQVLELPAAVIVAGAMPSATNAVLPSPTRPAGTATQILLAATATSTSLPAGTSAGPAATATATVHIPPTATSTAVVLPSSTAVPANSAIGGRVYRDENGNGNFNPADTPLSGVVVQLGSGSCPSSGLGTTQTNGEGVYSFSNLPSGAYCVTVNTGSLPSIGGTWQASLPNPINVTVAVGETLGGKNFMFQPIIQ